MNDKIAEYIGPIGILITCSILILVLLQIPNMDE